jgi:ABC-type phosphate transport system substrate-binding protein
MKITKSNIFQFTLVCLLFTSCDNYFKNDYKDNSPTSGKLKVYFDEGLSLHIKNQANTFSSHYMRAEVNLVPSNDDNAVNALYNDSCEAIIISRPMNEKEKKAFASKNFYPKFSGLAYSGLVFVTNVNSSIKSLSKENILSLYSVDGACSDSLLKPISIKALIDKNNSSIAHYVLDSVLSNSKMSNNVSALKSTLEALNYVSENKNMVACIDFAWLSDVDDSISKYYANKIKILGIQLGEGKVVYPSQSSFKLKTYPYTRLIYFYRKTGDFTLAKGFETYIAGPKGQTTFLKQGLLPYKQQERIIEVKFEAIKN